MNWYDASKTRPQSGRKVIVRWHNAHGKVRTTMAAYYGPKTLEAGEHFVDTGGAEYDEATDAYWAPAGWYELTECDNNDGAVYPFDGAPEEWLPLWVLDQFPPGRTVGEVVDL